MELSTLAANAARNFPPPETEISPSMLFYEWKERARAGDFRGAWRVSDRALNINRQKELSGSPEHLRPLWNGQAVEGKRVLVRCFHGLGDTIQFARFVPRLAKIAAKVEVRVQPALADLFSPLSSTALIRSRYEPEDEQHDVEIEIMELAHALRIELAT